MIQNLERRSTPAFWGIAFYVVVAMFFLRFVLNFNSPYLDECDYIFVGRALLSGEPWITKTYMFSSDIHLYIFGIADKIWSGEHSYLAARAISAVLGLCSLWFFYGFVKNIYAKHQDSRRIAEISTLLLALSVPHTFVSQFATYDIVCFFFFTAALNVLSQTLFAPDSESPTKQDLMLIAGSALFATAVLSKYIAVVYAPLIFLVLLLLKPRAGLIFGVIAGIILGSYIWLNRAELLQLYQNQIVGGTHRANATVWKLLGTVGEYVGFTAFLALWLITLRTRAIQNIRFYAVLVIFALPLAAYHLRSGDIISLYKHLLYACCFLTPIAGEALYHTLFVAAERNNNWLRAIAGTALVVAAVLLKWQLTGVHFAYPNTDAVSRLVRTSLTPETTILSEDAYLFRYACFPEIPTKNMEEMTWFDNNNDGKREAQDVIDAVWEGKFEYVYLNGLILKELGEELKRGVLRNKYDLILEIPYKNSSVMNPINTGTLSLYRRRSR